MDALNTVLQVATLAIVAWLPGAAMFRTPMLDRDRRAGLDAEERTFWAVILSVGLSLSAVLALAALGRYSFTRLVIIDLAVTGVIALAARGRLRMSGAKRLSATAAIPLALIVIGTMHFSPPSEYIMGGKDPGVYMNEGIQIAQRGSLTLQDETIAAVPPFARELFFPRYFTSGGTPRSDYYSLRFMGFFVVDPDTGAVVGQFPHLFPASIAIGYGIHGLTGARWTTPVWAVLGLLAVYFAGARLLGRTAAAIAAALLACNVAQIWFGRYPNAEMVMQALLFAALLANARAHVDGQRFFAPVAGGLLGLLLFLRLDTALGIAAVIAAIGLAWVTGQRPRRSFWIALVIPSVAAFVYMVGPMRPYSHLYLSYISNLTAWHYAVLITVAIAAVLLLLVARNPRASRLVSVVAPPLLAAFVVVAGVYALFLRHPAGRLAAHDAYALRTFANFYVTVPGVLAALLGFWLMARQRFWKDPALFLTVAVFATSVFYKIRIVPEHFWMARRFIPVILPGALLFVCAAAFATTTGGWRTKVVRWTVGGIFVVLLASAFMRTSEPVLDHSEYEGMIPKIEALAGRFGDDDLVLVESRDAGGDVHVLATPLAYTYARNVLLLASAKPDKADMAAFIEWALARYDRVFFVGGGGTDLVSRSYSTRPVVAERFEVPEFESTTHTLPTASARKVIFAVHEFIESQRLHDGAWFDLDVGTNDDLHVLRFHSSEQSEGTSFRWTQTASYVTVPSITPTARELTLVLHDGGRPAAAPPADVVVYLADERIGQIEVSPGPFRPYNLTLPRELVARRAAADEPLVLRLVSTTWNPNDLLGTGDDRNLGVMVDRVTIK